MELPSLPGDDQARLSELRSLRVLDTPEDPHLDSISELARRFADADIAIISLVDEHRQWFKSCVGLPLDRRETPRSISFCAHAILQPEPLIVEDALQDPRFADNPLVVGAPGIRFYAGFPLVSGNGYALGSLCVIRLRPASLSSEQIDSLNRLASLAADYLCQSRFRAADRSNNQPEGSGFASGSWALPNPDAPASLGRLLSREQLMQTTEAAMAMQLDASFALLRCAFRDYDRVNATLGPNVAEDYMDEVVRRLLGCCPRSSRMARISEAEILILLPLEGADGHLEKIAQRIIDFVGQPYRSGPHLISTSLSLGIAVFRNDYDAAATLLADAGLALRIAARSSASAFRFVDSDTRTVASETFRLESDLREAIQQSLLEPYFQPIVDLNSKDILGFEGLARWPRNAEVLSPASFLPTLINAGLVGELDLVIVAKTLAAMPLLALAVPQKTMVISLNLSGNLLEEPQLRGRLLSLLDESPLPPGWSIQVELIEDAFQHSSSEFESFLSELASRSVAIVIDDFGTGYSSLSRLVSLPVQGVKVDRMFVQRLTASAESPRTLLRTMLSMLTDLGLTITAEGVETEAQRAWLQSHGVSKAQGFLFHQPLAVSEAMELLRSLHYLPSAIPVASGVLRHRQRSQQRKGLRWFPFFDRRRSRS